MNKTKQLIAATLALTTLFLAGCSKTSNSADSSDLKTIKVGASPAPHAEILEQTADILEANGYKLEIVEFTDYVIPNTSLDGGDLDANFFQHTPYLTDFNEKHGTNIVSVADVHFEPLGIYAGISSDLSNIKDGAKIAIPNDTTNEARALQLLAAEGIITLRDGVGLEATLLDITSNPKNIEILELESATIPNVIDEVDFAIVNGNYALSSGIIEKVIKTEDPTSEAALTFANILAVNAGDEDREDIKALVSALTSDEVKNYIEKTYGVVVIPVF